MQIRQYLHAHLDDDLMELFDSGVKQELNIVEREMVLNLLQIQVLRDIRDRLDKLCDSEKSNNLKV